MPRVSSIGCECLHRSAKESASVRRSRFSSSLHFQESRIGEAVSGIVNALVENRKKPLG